MSTRFVASMLLVALIIWGCASAVRQGDELFEAGDYAQAASAYEAYLDSEPPAGPATSRALYRLAVTYAAADGASYDAARSAALLEHLLTEDPEGEYSLAAEVMLRLQKEVVSMGAVVASRRDLIQALSEDLSRLQQDLVRTESEMGAKDEAVQTLFERIQRLRDEITRLSRELSEREQELERLKQIDLEAPPL
jgi:chromosome segregation ATPase